MVFEIKTPALKKASEAGLQIMELAMRGECDVKITKDWTKRIGKVNSLVKKNSFAEAEAIADAVLKEIRDYRETL
ncbi:MAG: hypothetical protein AB7F91_14455 [Parvularculaceae bacterium]